jgi:hypothetical protein
MTGLSLIHAGFLAAGLAVAVPLIIHLLFRQKTRTVPIGSIRFLQQVVREHRRRRRVRQWLLLLLRMAAVLLLALLFARPYWDESVRRGLEQEIVYLVDRSASMQAVSGSTALFDEALEVLGSELEVIDENTIVHVGLCDATGVEEIAVDKLADAAPSQAATDHALGIAWAKDVLAASSRSDRRVILISDLQRTGLAATGGEQLPPEITLEVHDVGRQLAHNVSVDLADAVSTEIVPDRPVKVRVLVRNHGALAVKQLPIRCELEGPDGKLNASEKHDIPGGATATIDLPFTIQQDGVYRGRVAIDADDVLAVDDTRWLAIEARHPDRVLLVDGQEGRAVFGNETYYLETALRLHTEEIGGQLRSFEVERIVWEAGEGFPRLDGYRAVVLANVRRLTAQDAARLDAYLRAGGSLLVFAGDQVTEQSVAPLAASDLLPGPVAAGPVDTPVRVDQWDGKHDALACFDDPQHGDLRRIEFNTFLPLSSLTPFAKPLLSAGSHIVAAETPVGPGRVIYLGCSADRDWSDLPRTRIYVPLMRQLLAYLTNQLGEQRAVRTRTISKRGESAGVTEADGQWVVTNVEPRESIPDRLTTDELSKRLGAGENSFDRTAALAALKLTLPADALRPEEAWTIVVWVLLVVLAVETLLAGRVHA